MARSWPTFSNRPGMEAPASHPSSESRTCEAAQAACHDAGARDNAGAMPRVPGIAMFAPLAAATQPSMLPEFPGMLQAAGPCLVDGGPHKVHLHALLGSPCRPQGPTLAGPGRPTGPATGACRLAAAAGQPGLQAACPALLGPGGGCWVAARREAVCQLRQHPVALQAAGGAWQAASSVQPGPPGKSGPCCITAHVATLLDWQGRCPVAAGMPLSSLPLVPGGALSQQACPSAVWPSCQAAPGGPSAHLPRLLHCITSGARRHSSAMASLCSSERTRRWP